MAPTISLCMICRDESHTIGRCLRQARNLADEIVFVDTGSTDDTRARAAAFTDRIFDFAWQDDFSAARNHALSKARGDWILILDADELIYPAEAAEARRIVNAGGHGAIVFDRYEFQADYTRLRFDDEIPWPAIQTEVQSSVRLLEKTTNPRFTGRIHEKMEFDAPPGSICSPGLKFAHFRDKHTRVRRSEYYMRLELEALAREPSNSNAHYNVLCTYLTRGWQAEFRDALGRIGYLEPRYVRLFDALRVRIEPKGWLLEARLLADLVQRNAPAKASPGANGGQS